MSECYVAANMRTSFTDLAETGSLSSNMSTSQSIGGQSSAQSLSSSNDFHKSSNDYLHKQQFSSSSQLQNLNHRPINPPVSNHHNLIHSTSHHNLNQTTSNHNFNMINNNNSNNSSNQLQSSHSQLANQQIGVQYNTHNNHHHNHSYSATNSIPHHRLSQPTRTQIPIHCYIEQLDACADLPGYNPSITDNELFSTSDKPLPTQNNQQNHSNHYAQTHLHQSKLALESVTNCNGLSGNSLTRNESGTNSTNLARHDNVDDSDNNNDDIDNCNNTTTITTSSSSLFHDSEVNNNAGDDDLDTNLDHLNSDSPSSVHHQLPSHQDSISISESFNHQAAPSSYDSHHFQSCRETYAIVTSNVLYIDLLRTVLLQLGYSAMDLINAKGKQHSYISHSDLVFQLMLVGCTVFGTPQNP